MDALGDLLVKLISGPREDLEREIAALKKYTEEADAEIRRVAGLGEKNESSDGV
jgi:hypothetical protein